MHFLSQILFIFWLRLRKDCSHFYSVVDSPCIARFKTRVIPLSLDHGFETLKITSEALPVPTEALPVPTEALPIPSEALPIPFEALPLPSEALPVLSEALPVPS